MKKWDRRIVLIRVIREIRGQIPGPFFVTSCVLRGRIPQMTDATNGPEEAQKGTKRIRPAMCCSGYFGLVLLPGGSRFEPATANAGLGHFLHFKSFEAVDLRFVSVSDFGIAELRLALPSLDIDR